MLEADLEKSKGHKENAVAEERMKARSHGALVGKWGFLKMGVTTTGWSMMGNPIKKKIKNG